MAAIITHQYIEATNTRVSILVLLTMDLIMQPRKDFCLIQEAERMLFNLDFYATAGFNDREEDVLYLVIDGTLKEFAQNATKRSYTWKSKVFYTNRPISLGWQK